MAWLPFPAEEVTEPLTARGSSEVLEGMGTLFWFLTLFVWAVCLAHCQRRRLS